MPKKSTENYTPAKQYRLGASTSEKLASLATHYDISESDVIRMLVADGYSKLAAREKSTKNPATPT